MSKYRLSITYNDKKKPIVKYYDELFKAKRVLGIYTSKALKAKTESFKNVKKVVLAQKDGKKYEIIDGVDVGIEETFPDKNKVLTDQEEEQMEKEIKIEASTEEAVENIKEASKQINENTTIPVEGDRSQLEQYPEKDLNEMIGFKKELEAQIQEITKIFGSLSEVEQRYLGKDMIETIAKVSQISQFMLSRPATNSTTGITYSFERFNLKELLDMQFMLSGYHGYISSVLGRLRATALLKKAYLEVTTTYVYQTVYDHIQETYDRKPTIPEIESVIKSNMKEQYAFQRISGALAILLETVLDSVEFIRNVLNSTIVYLKEDSINSLHLAKSGV